MSRVLRALQFSFVGIGSEGVVPSPNPSPIQSASELTSLTFYTFLAQRQRSMNTRKRPAEELLLPFYAPKHPRTAMVGYDGGTTSAPDRAGILSRWKRVVSDLSALTLDTVKVALDFTRQYLYKSLVESNVIFLE